MRGIRIFVLVVLTLAILAFVVYGTCRFLLPHWPPILFYSYVILGVVVSVLGAVVLFRDLAKTQDTKDRIKSAIADVTQKRSLPNKVRSATATAALTVGSAIVWPVDVLRGIVDTLRAGLTRGKQHILRQSLQSAEQHRSLFVAICISSIYLLGLHGFSGHGYGRLFVYILGASVILRHISYSVELDGLPMRLRRTTGSPYVTFLEIVLADFVSLVLSFTLFSSPRAPSQMTFSDIHSTAVSLYQFKELYKLLTGVKLTFAQVAIGSAGLLFYLALFRILTRVKDFRRSDEDYHWLASRQFMLGNFAAGLRYLNSIEKPIPETEFHRVLGLLGVNEIEKAEETARRVIEQKGDKPTTDQVFSVLGGAPLFVPLPEHVIFALMTKAIEDGVSDVYLMDAVGMMAADSLVLRDRLLELLLPTKSDHPLTISLLLILSDKPLDALAVVQQATPGTELEEIVRLVMQLRASLLNPNTSYEEDSQTLAKWRDSDLQTVRSILPNLSSKREKALAYGQVGGIRPLALVFDKQTEQELTYLADQLKAEVRGDAIAEMMVKVTEQRIESEVKKAESLRKDLSRSSSGPS